VPNTPFADLSFGMPFAGTPIRHLPETEQPRPEGVALRQGTN